MSATANSYPPPNATAPRPPEREAVPAADGRAAAGGARHGERKVLILDDDKDILELYKKIITRLPSHPRVQVADNATSALALLEAEPFELFITDLRMPKIDGFQVLLSARQRWPDLKTIVMTGVGNQQYRELAYDSGIDLYTEKPTTPAEIRIFGECVEGLLLKGEKERGFRGIQNKSLMDLVQIECLSLNSTTLKITSGALEGRVWIVKGNVIDAEAMGMRGQEAFRFIFGWKTGNFESMPGDPGRERTIFSSCDSLLLECAQNFDESSAGGEAGKEQARDREFTLLATVNGVQSLLLIGKEGECDLWGIENAEAFVTWTRRVLRDFQGLGNMLKAGQLHAVQAAGRVRALIALPVGDRQLLAGMDRKLTVKFLRKAGWELAKHLGRDLRVVGKEPVDETALTIKTEVPATFPCGNYSVTPTAQVVDSTMPPSFPRVIMEVIGKVVLAAFSSARDLETPLTEIAADFRGLEIRARDTDQGAIIFITPQEY
jgi:DNA-binding response OmpR family regulator